MLPLFDPGFCFHQGLIQNLCFFAVGVFQSDDGLTLFHAFPDDFCQGVCRKGLSAFTGHNPVAVFLALAYLVIGLLVPAAVDAPLKNDDGTYKYKTTIERWDHYLAQTVQMLVVTVDDLDCTGDLAAGRLVERATIFGALFKVLLLRTGLMALVGIIILNRRELGLVVRKL